jgi:hypothetical protein
MGFQPCLGLFSPRPNDCYDNLLGQAFVLYALVKKDRQLIRVQAEMS